MAVSTIAPAQIVLIVLGEVVAGGFRWLLAATSLLVPNRKYLKQRIAIERYEIKHEPEEERAELREIYRQKGFSGPLFYRVVGHLTAHEDGGIECSAHAELGVVEDRRIIPWLQGSQIGLSFVVGGTHSNRAGATRIASSSLVGIWSDCHNRPRAAGAIKARYTHKSSVRAGLEFLAVVTIGTLAGVGAGLLLHGV